MKKVALRLTSALALCGAHYGQYVHADEQALSLFEMPLQDLLNISVVSKKSETLSQSPGVVSTYEIDDLRSLGLSDLSDFLHFVPGIEINEKLNGLRVAQIRGLPANSNQKVLFLLDGVPYWMPESGEIPLDGIPVEAIERIEVIRGPGSVIYGTNASAGVINIVLRKDNKLSATAYQSDERMSNASINLGGAFKNGAWFNVSGEIQRDQGYRYEVKNAFAQDACFCFPPVANGELIRKKEHTSFLARGGVGGLTATAHHFTANETGDVSSSLISPSEYESYGTLISLNYKHDFGKLDLELFSDWNRYYRDVIAKNLLGLFFLETDGGITFDNHGRDNIRFRNCLAINYRFSDAFIFQAGSEYEERSTENKKFRDNVGGDVLRQTTLPPFNFPFQLQDDNSVLLVAAGKDYEISLFFQGNLSLGMWRVVAGARSVDNSETGSELSPRGSIVYSIDDYQSIKVLYSEGFNSPTFGQKSATDSRGIPLNTDVIAEKISTIDFAYTHTKGNLHQVYNFYHAEAEGLIFSTENRSDIIRRDGIEYDLQYRRDRLHILSGISFVYQGNGKGKDPYAEFTSKWMIKLGANYRFSRHNIGASLRSGGAREKVDGYHLLDINYSLEISNQFSLFGIVTNALDENIFHPSVGNLNQIEIQAENGIGLLLGFRYKQLNS